MSRDDKPEIYALLKRLAAEHPSEWTEDELVAELLREHPELKLDYLPDGNRVIRGIRLKPEAEKFRVLGRRLLKEKP